MYLILRSALTVMILMPVLAVCPLPARAGQADDPRIITIERVIDGDTVDVRFDNGRLARVRLLDIDAPETSVKRARCRRERRQGRIASEMLTEFFAANNYTVLYGIVAVDSYDRLLGRIKAGPGFEPTGSEKTRAEKFPALVDASQWLLANAPVIRYGRKKRWCEKKPEDK